MNDNSQIDSSRPNMDDSTLDRYLKSLPHFFPCAGFEERVMSRVIVHPPPWVLNMKQSVRSLVQTRRFRWIAAGLMATSTISMVVATTFVLSNFSTVSHAVGRTTTTIGIPIWRAFGGLASHAVRDVFAFSTPVLGSRNATLIVSVVAVGFLVFSSVMLFCLMRPKCFARSK